MTTETGSRAWVWCGVAVVVQMVAVLLAVSVWASPDFATDFENGTRIANAGPAATVASVLVIIGIFCALTAVFRAGASALACGAGSLLLLAGCATGLLIVPLFGHYS